MYMSKSVNSKNTNTYWIYALELCDFKSSLEELKSQYIFIDHYWRKIEKNLKDDGTFEYPQLLALVKLFFSMSCGSCPREGICDKQISTTIRYADPPFHKDD